MGADLGTVDYLTGIPNDRRNFLARSKNNTSLNGEVLTPSAASSRASCVSTRTINSANSVAESGLPSIGDRASMMISALRISSGISLAGGKFPAMAIGLTSDELVSIIKIDLVNLSTIFGYMNLHKYRSNL